LRQAWQAEHLAAAVARATGAEVEMPSWQEAREAFDEQLFAEPDPVEADRQTQLVALGLR
jgi:hypothetical protein